MLDLGALFEHDLGDGVRAVATARGPSENEQKMTPASASLALNVVATDTESTTASIATPERRSCSAREMPSLSNIARSSGSTSSRLPGAALGLGAA